MALADILDAIERQTDAEIAAATREADDKIAGILERGAQEAAAVEAAASDARRDEATAAAERIRNRAHLEADRQLRSARDAIVVDLLAGVRERLARLRDTPGYPQVLRRLISEARIALPAATVVHVDPRDVGRVTELLESQEADRSAKPELHADLETWGGAIATCPDGRSVHNTLELRLQRADPHLRQLVVELVPALGTRPS